MKRKHLLYLSFTWSVIFATASAGNTPLYTLHEIIPTNPILTSNANYINNNGEVVGTTGEANNRRAVYWHPVNGQIQLSLPPNVTSAKACVITDDSEIYGYGFRNYPPYNSSTAIWKKTGEHTVIDIPGARIDDINTEGRFVGCYGNLKPFGIAKAMAWDPISGMQTLQNPESMNESWARGINDSGYVVGITRQRDVTGWRAAYWDNGVPGFLPVPDDCTGRSSVGDVNNSGKSVGYIEVVEGPRAAVWSNADSVTKLADPTVPFTSSYASCINEKQEIVGAYRDSDGNYRAAIWTKDGDFHDLASLLADQWNGWTLQFCKDNNDSGQIVGVGINPSGVERGFILTPVPEPSTISILIIVACTLRRTKRHR